jgi:hypothetical protein
VNAKGVERGTGPSLGRTTFALFNSWRMATLLLDRRRLSRLVMCRSSMATTPPFQARCRRGPKKEKRQIQTRQPRHASRPRPKQFRSARLRRPQKIKPYTLKVDGNQFSVSGEELLRYAEIDESEAGEFSEPALIRLAQKQFAASNRLAQANALKDQARRQTPQAPAPQEQPRPAPQAPSGRADPALVAAIEKIQLGDPEEAARALVDIFEAGVEHRIKANDLTRSIGDVCVATDAVGRSEECHGIRPARQPARRVRPFRRGPRLLRTRDRDCTADGRKRGG